MTSPVHPESSQPMPEKEQKPTIASIVKRTAQLMHKEKQNQEKAERSSRVSHKTFEKLEK